MLFSNARLFLFRSVDRFLHLHLISGPIGAAAETEKVGPRNQSYNLTVFHVNQALYRMAG